MAWLFTGEAAGMAMRVLVMAILARVLSPGDFGLFGAAMIFISFSDMLVTTGLRPVIIQVKELSNHHISTANSLSIIINIIVGTSIFALSGIISDLMKMESLPLLLKTLSFAFILRGFTIVPRSLMERDLSFKLLAKINFMNYVISRGTIGVIFALNGFGVWSLVAASIGGAIFDFLVILIIRKENFIYGIKPAIAKTFLRNGFGFGLGKIANHLAYNADYYIVGKFLGQEALGYYNRSYNLMMLPTNLFGSVLSKILFPTISRLQSDISQIEKIYLALINITGIVFVPISVFIMIFGKELVILMLGSQWSNSVVPLQILSSILFFRVAYKYSDVVANAKGAVYNRAVRQWLFLLLIVIGSYIGSVNGIVGVALGVSIAVFVNFIIMNHLTTTLLEIKQSKVIMHVVILILLQGILLAVTSWVYQYLLELHLSIISVLVIGLLIVVVMSIALVLASMNQLSVERKLMKRVFDRVKNKIKPDYKARNNIYHG